MSINDYADDLDGAARWWEVGDSQLLLWLSALLQFTVIVTVVGSSVGWLTAKIAGLFFRKP